MISLIVMLIVYLGHNYYTKYNKKSSSNITDKIDNNNSNEVKKNDIDTVEYNGYVYIVPGDVGYDFFIDGDEIMLHLYNNIDKWGGNIRILDKNKYNGALSDYDKLGDELKNDSNIITNKRFIIYINTGKDKPILINHQFGKFCVVNSNITGIVASIVGISIPVVLITDFSRTIIARGISEKLSALLIIK